MPGFERRWFVLTAGGKVGDLQLVYYADAHYEELAEIAAHG